MEVFILEARTLSVGRGFSPATRDGPADVGCAERQIERRVAARGDVALPGNGVAMRVETPRRVVPHHYERQHIACAQDLKRCFASVGRDD